MRVDFFDFDLDKSLIAKEPVNPRDASKLLDLSIEGEIHDRHFYDLPDILQKGDVLVFNDTKVIPARLYGYKDTGAKIEVFPRYLRCFCSICTTSIGNYTGFLCEIQFMFLYLPF